MAQILTADRLKELLCYDSKCGDFSWKKSIGKRARIGAVAGSLTKNGYWCIRLEKKLYLAHRLAWLYVYGEWPSDYIDHINSKPLDNRIENLRVASQFLNMQNLKKAKITSKTGVLGVSMDNRKKNPYYVRLVLNHKTHHIGRFANLDLAKESYLQAKRKLHINCTI